MNKDFYITLDDSEEDMIVLEKVETITKPEVFNPICKIVNAANKDVAPIPVANILVPMLPFLGRKFKDRYYIMFADKVEILKVSNMKFEDALNLVMEDFLDKNGAED